MKRKMIAFLVALCLLLTGLPGTPVKANAAEAEKESVSVDTSALAALPAYQPEEDCKILDYVHADVFARGDHVARLHEEESLSSYAFLNRDGTKTVYYLDEVVKFEAADGRILEKDLTLRSEKGGYATTQNDVSLHLPVSPASGVRLSYNNKQVTLISQGGSATAATDGKAVRYANYYGPGMDLVYTPTTDGVKEEIILSAYSGVNSFTFLLNTGGLNLYQSGNRHFLAESKLSDSKIWLGALEIFDAAIQPGPGNVTVETVMPGQQYRITLTVDEDYLTDPSTVYPVTIDPTLTVSDNTHGAGAIEDAPIYEGYPTSNFGSYQYNRAGYAGTTYKKGRTVVRLKGMLDDETYTSVGKENIQSVTFYMAEATGTSNVMVGIHPLNANYSWTESGVTWNTATAYEAAAWATASPDGGAFGAFDITGLVKSWKTGLLQDGQGGFVMIGTNESSVDKSLCSSEHTSTTKRPYVVVNYSCWLNYSTLVMNRGGATKTLQLNCAVGGIEWETSMPSVATVSDSGVITPKQIGVTIITARDTAGNEAECTVRVVLPTGVYQFINKGSGLYMHTAEAGITTGTDVVQSSEYSSGLNQKAQLWRVNHLGEGRYSIRPLHKLSLCLYAETGNVMLVEQGDVDNKDSVNDNAEWMISYVNRTEGYRIRRGGLETRTLKAYQNSLSDGASLTAQSDSSGNPACRWNIVQVTPPAPEIILYDKETERPVTTQAYHVKPGQTLTPDQYGLAYAYAGADSWNQVLHWTSSDPSKVSVDPTTGAITGVTTKTFVTITVSKLGSTATAKSFDVYCLQNNYKVDLEVLYDHGYQSRFPNAVSRINNNLKYLQGRYLSEFGVFVNFSEPTLFTSLADECDAPNESLCDCEDTNVDDANGLYTPEENHHTNLFNVLYDALSADYSTPKMVFIGHSLCQVRNGNCASVTSEGVSDPDYNISLIYASSDLERMTVVHEFGHLFGAIDHNDKNWHDEGWLEGQYEALDFDGDCIYGTNWQDNDDVVEQVIICDGCKTLISNSITNPQS